jgi:hypothetical protein
MLLLLGESRPNTLMWWLFACLLGAVIDLWFDNHFNFPIGKYLLCSTAYCMIFRKLNIGNIYRKWYEGLEGLVHIKVLPHSIVDVIEKGERGENVGRLGGGCRVGTMILD